VNKLEPPTYKKPYGDPHKKKKEYEPKWENEEG
jgi:hypothetical protein